jgi:hypothetical protein
MNCRHLKVGDKVKRVIGHLDGDHTIMNGTVMAVEEETIKVAMEGTEHWPLNELWTFNREYGCEEDEELGWGVVFRRTGSYLMLERADGQLERTNNKS